MSQELPEEITQKPYQALTNPSWRPGKEFWRAVRAVVLIATAVTVGEVAQHAKDTFAGTEAAVKLTQWTYPEAASAINEFNRCMYGHGDYDAKTGKEMLVFMNEEQCEARAITNSAVDVQDQVRRALTHRATAVRAAEALVIPAWPLSVFF